MWALREEPRGETTCLIQTKLRSYGSKSQKTTTKKHLLSLWSQKNGESWISCKEGCCFIYMWSTETKSTVIYLGIIEIFYLIFSPKILKQHSYKQLIVFFYISHIWSKKFKKSKVKHCYKLFSHGKLGCLDSFAEKLSNWYKVLDHYWGIRQKHAVGWDTTSNVHLEKINIKLWQLLTTTAEKKRVNKVCVSLCWFACRVNNIFINCWTDFKEKPWKY